MIFRQAVGTVILIFILLLFARYAFAQPAVDEPANVTQIRKDFFDAVTAIGRDPAQCSLKLVEKGDGLNFAGIVAAECSDQPYRCYFVVHPTEAAAQALGCEDRRPKGAVEAAK